MQTKTEIDNKVFYRKLWKLALPISFQSLMLAAVAAGDALMLGRVAQEEMTAVSLATTIAPGSIPNRLPGLQNVYLAGQWLRMPGGLPMAAASGRDAALAVAKAAG